MIQFKDYIMIREVIRPQYTNFTINIPTSYIDREIEFIMFPLDVKEELNTQAPQNKKSLKGVFNNYADASKMEPEGSAWQDHIIKKFAND
jgi:hypothetical protein